MSDLSDRLKTLALKPESTTSRSLVDSPRRGVATFGRPGGPLDQRSERSQLSVTTYFSDDLFRREMELIFQHGPRYLGHELAVPEVGDYHALPQEGEGRALVRTANGVELLSNVCRHRQALMLRGRGNTHHTAPGHAAGNIVCPLHRWTYSLQGELLGAPLFQQDPCLNLNRYQTRSWNGMVFEDNGRDIAAELGRVGPKADLDFTGYVLDKVHLHECNYNWKTFIEVYLEDYHVGPFHPGLGRFVNCDDLKWEFSAHHSVQTVGINDSLRQAGSPAYKRWHEAVLALGNGAPPKQGALWLTYYPNIMVEFYYPEEIAAFEREFIESEQAAYMETCIEDDEAGPYQSPMEDGMQHFHEWYRRVMGIGRAPW